MKRFTLKGLIFLAGLAIFFHLMGYFEPDKLKNNSNIIRIELLQEFGDLDYLFLGSSYTYSGIDTGLFEQRGCRAFNAGTATASVFFYDLLIGAYLTSAESKPCHVVMEVSLISFTDKSDNWTYVPIHKYLKDELPDEIILCRYGDLKEYLLRIKDRSYWALKNLLTDLPGEDTEKVDRLREKLSRSRGYSERAEIFDPKDFDVEERFYADLNDDELDMVKVKNLIELVKDLEKGGINVTLAEIPSFRLREFLSNDYLADYGAIFDYFEEKNVDYIRCDLVMPPDYFRNIDHMNKTGAKVYTEWLMDRLKECPCKRPNKGESGDKH